MCENGTGMDQDYPRAAELYEMAASNHLSPAQYNLGVLYAKGLGVSQDLDRAKELFKLAADKGHDLARQNLTTLEALEKGESD